MTTKTTIAQPAEPGRSGDATGLSLLVMSAEAFVSLPLPQSGQVSVGRSTKCDVQVDDPLVSRHHVRLHIGPTLEIEDMRGVNRTRVRDVPIDAGARVPLASGEAVGIGSTVLVVERARRVGTPRRIWSHKFFEARLREECQRGAEAGRAFALGRLHLERPLPWVQVVPILDRDVPAPHLFAAYGPHDYELLLFELTQEDAAQLIDTVRRSLAALDSQPSAAIAWYPRDGRTADALLARANALVRPKAESSAPNIVLPAEPASAMAQVLEFARRAAKGTINILILGETGVGKEVMAQAIHRQSPRANGRLLPLNCAGLSEGLLESELFGYEKGAFTGAVQAKIGLLEAASGGSIFLDEVGEMTLPVQARVLRAIANREILPLGALKPRPIDVRLIAATNRDLVAEVAKGRFRRDLYYRLNGISLKIPPLRERRTEIPALAATFLVEHASDLGRAAPTLSPASRDLIERHEWRGNIRELKNVIERALLLCEGDVIHPEHLSLESDGATAFAEVEATEPTRVRDLTYEQEDERRVILEVLKANVWNQSRAARALGMPRRTLIAKLDRYRIPRPQKGAHPSLPDDDDDEAS